MAQAFVYVDQVGWVALASSQLDNSGVTAGTYGDATHIGQFTVTAQGVITAASNVAAAANVASLDSITGAVILNAGANITITDNSPSAGHITIAATGSSSPLTTKGDIFGHSTIDARIPVGTDGQILTSDSSQALGVSWQNGSSSNSGGLGVYADGSDGAQTFDGAATILGMAPVGNVYTLTRDIFLSSSTINNGVSITTNGYRIFCQGTLTNNGTIMWNGLSAGNSGSGATTTSNSNSTISTAIVGTSGGGGGTAGVGGNGTAASSCVNYGSTGGHGGSGSSTGGGNGGTVITPSVKSVPLRFSATALIGYGFTGDGNPTTGLRIAGGTGGGGGGGDGTNSGGGGGAGGGVVIVSARTFAGTGAIQARGGAGGTRTVGNVGGGGGGGGGFVIVVSGSVSGAAIAGQTIDASGGAKGSPHGTGTDNAVAGTDGSVYLIPN